MNRENWEKSCENQFAEHLTGGLAQAGHSLAWTIPSEKKVLYFRGQVMWKPRLPPSPRSLAAMAGQRSGNKQETKTLEASNLTKS